MNMSGLHGSFLHIMEYAKFFKSMDAEIFLGSVFMGAKIKEIAAKEKYHLYPINKLPVHQEFDLVYSLHIFLFPYLLFKGLAYKHAIHALLSVKSPLEQLPPSCMYPYFDLITVLSPEIAMRYNDEFQISPSRFMLVPNPIPLNFLSKSKEKTEWNEKISRVAVVSNHKLPELIEMAHMAPWHTDFFGMEYGNSVNITPELLLGYDAIITIGKTVQYGMSLGIPIFEYDHNGGCGWITPQNMEIEAMTNFSGRSTFKKRDGEKLVKDMKEGYGEAISQIASLREKALKRFSIIELIKSQLKTIWRMPSKETLTLSADAWFYCNTCYLALEYILGLANKNAT